MEVLDADGKRRNIDIFFDKKSTKGRPRKILTNDALKLVENLSRIMCTDEEIAQCLGASVDTLLNNDNKELFRNATEKGRANGKQSLRRKQYEVAMKGNSSMLIWLGKQWLGQTDKVEQTTSFEDLTPLADMLKLTPEEIKGIEGANASDKLE